MGTYETISDLDKALDEVSLPKSKKKEAKKRVSTTSEQKIYSYKLFDEIKNGILFFGKIQIGNNKKITAEFICRCNEAFRSELPPILSGKIKTCGCKVKK